MVFRELAFFGAFNPPTVAHLDLALFAMERTGARRVLFVPSGQRYILNDQGKDLAYSDSERVAMLRAAAEKRPWMTVIDWETRQETQPRTYTTLCHLRDEGHQPALLIGSDKLAEMERAWRYVPEIAREFGIVCLTRGADECDAMIAGSPFLSALRDGIRVIETPEATRSVSSTRARQCVAAIRALREELDALVPGEIQPYLWGKGR